MQAFQKIYNNTVSLIENLDNAEEEDKEELQIRIDSNIQALNIYKNNIKDENDMETLQNLLDSMKKTEFFKIERKDYSKTKKRGDDSHIDDELLKGTLALKNKAERFQNALKVDDIALKKAVSGFSKNSVENQRNLQTISKNSNYLKTSTIFFIIVFIFFAMYFIIRCF